MRNKLSDVRDAEDWVKKGHFDKALASLFAVCGISSPGIQGGSLLTFNPEQNLLFGQIWNKERLPRLTGKEFRTLRRALAGRRRPEAFVLRAFLDLIGGGFGAAARLLDEAEEAKPRLAWLYLLRGSARSFVAREERRRSPLRGALADLDRAIALDPRLVDAYALRGEIRHDVGELRGALSDLNRIVKLRPDFMWAYAERGQVHADLGGHREAAADFERLVRAYPDSGWVYALRGAHRARTGELAAALEDFRRARGREPGSSLVLAAHGEALLAAGRLGEAAAAFDAALRGDAKCVMARLGGGRIRLLRGDWKAAARELARACADDPRYREAFLWRAEALFRLGRCEEAFGALDRALPMDARLGWLGRGSLWRDLDAAVARRPRDAWALALRGRFRVEGGMAPEGGEDLTRALELDPSCSRARAWRGEARRRMGEAAAAVSDCARAARECPGLAWARAWKGRAELDLGRPERAEKDLSAAIALDSETPLFYAWRGEAFAALGRSAEAARDRGTALLWGTR